MDEASLADSGMALVHGVSRLCSYRLTTWRVIDLSHFLHTRKQSLANDADQQYNTLTSGHPQVVVVS